MATTMHSSNSYSPTNSSASSPHTEFSYPLLSPIASVTVQNIAGMVPTKLNRHNYITWRNLFLPILKRFKLLRLIDGTNLCPSQFVPDSAGLRVLNSAHEIWCERDQILIIWINLTLSEDLLPLIV
ncbi:hypothetical protein C1H46_025050 [Malus baccata]|uniref:Retrotransposon Copia-like N-terminal domain-containing protein n=1 Tax=Malus baccata TaxID=106549 RepID=A0A540LSH3_MALBA|nr:hypothetical protein C1H46_025050 [Malus baccata]